MVENIEEILINDEIKILNSQCIRCLYISNNNISVKYMLLAAKSY